MVRKAIGHYNTLHANRDSGEIAVYEEFGRRLQARMNQLGWNQSELSRRATDFLPKPAKGQVQGHSVGRDRISSYIRGKYLPRPDALDAIAKALKCEPEDLLPARGVPSIAQEHPEIEMREVGGRIAMRINRTVSQKTATEIMNLLLSEDA